MQAVELLHVVDYLHELLANGIGLFSCGSLAIDADDGLGVRLAQMYPTISKVNLHAVDIVHGLNVKGCSRIEELLHLLEDGIDIRCWLQVDAVLCHEIVGIGLAELAYLAAFLCQLRQEEGNTHEGITAIVAGRIDNTAIAFTADDGTDLLHECGDVHLAYCRSAVLAAMTLGDIAQRTRRREVANGTANLERPFKWQSTKMLP